MRASVVQRLVRVSPMVATVALVAMAGCAWRRAHALRMPSFQVMSSNTTIAARCQTWQEHLEVQHRRLFVMVAIEEHEVDRRALSPKGLEPLFADAHDDVHVGQSEREVSLDEMEDVGRPFSDRKMGCSWESTRPRAPGLKRSRSPSCSAQPRSGPSALVPGAHDDDNVHAALTQPRAEGGPTNESVGHGVPGGETSRSTSTGVNFRRQPGLFSQPKPSRDLTVTQQTGIRRHQSSARGTTHRP
jgi:hypothetical protein